MFSPYVTRPGPGTASNDHSACLFPALPPLTTTAAATATHTPTQTRARRTHAAFIPRTSVPSPRAGGPLRPALAPPDDGHTLRKPAPGVPDARRDTLEV